MKILLLTDRLDVGGAETHIAQLATGLLKLGNEVWVASAGGALADRLEKQGVVQIRMPLGSHSPIRWWLMRRKIHNLIKRERFDIAHAHARIPALLIRGARKLHCAEIVTVHAKFRSGLLRRLLSRWGEHSIAVSEDLRAYLHSVYAIPTERISVIPNGIDLARFTPLESKKDTDGMRILFASRLDRDCSRGAELLCEIAPLLTAHIPDLRITVAGGGQKMPDIAQRALKINQNLGFACITVCGIVEDMALLMREQDIFVGVSRAALEATACGCAVILCGNEGYGGILTDENFFEASLSNFCARGCQKPNAERLLSDLSALISSPSLRQKCTADCRRILESFYNSESVCRQTIDIYQKCLHSPSSATLAVGGYFGCGNLGDDAILQAFIEYTRKHYPNMHVIALTKNVREDMRRFGVRCVNRKNPFSVAMAFLRADVFLCGGGSLLQNLTGKLSLHYYLCMLRLARLCGATPILFAAGIGPLYGKKAWDAVQKTLSACPYISLRDEESLRFLSSHGLDPALLHEGADMALLLPQPPIFRTYAIAKRLKIAPNVRYVCISLKAGRHTSDSRRIITAALRMLCRHEELLPVFVPLDVGDISVNADAAHRLKGKLFFPDEATDISALLRNASLLVSMRLHGLILATTVSLPAVGISSADDQKIPSFARVAAQEYLTPEDLSAAALVEICQNLLTHRASLRPLIADACCDLQKNAKKDLANIASMVYNKGRDILKSEDTI